MAIEQARNERLRELEIRAFGKKMSRLGGRELFREDQFRNPSCVPDVVSFLADETTWGRQVGGVMILAALKSPNTIPALLAETGSANPTVRKIALRALLELDLPESAVAALVPVLEDKSAYRASLAIKNMLRVGDASARSALERAATNAELPRRTRRRARKAARQLEHASRTAEA